jgi:hypothetical protein
MNNNNEYLMNIASSLFFICYIPEFYANYKNKNANLYNVFEKIVMLGGCGFALGYSIKSANNSLIFNYTPLFALDSIALFMRAYYAYKNRNRDVTIVLDNEIIENPLYTDENL